MLKALLLKASVFSLLTCSLVTAACAGNVELKDPMRLPDGQVLKTVYFFPHWWEPWKSDDALVSADMKKMKDLGFNTVCLDHEISQAIDREWYWLDREYKMAGQEGMSILPWLQLQAVDRAGLMQFSHLNLKAAVNQDKKTEEDCINYRDEEFKKALAHYVSIYLDRYVNDPALLRVKDGKKSRPVVGLMVETGWRNTSGQPLSFDEETNAYFRKWMRAMYHDLKNLNKKWGTNYKSFDDIDPCDKTIFNYDFPDKQNMPMAVKEHVQFRARLINDALLDVAKQVRKRHKDVLFVAEVAYPFNLDDPNAAAYRWNNANEYRSVDFADIVCIRTMGGTTAGQVAKDQELLITNGKKIILSYRLLGDAFPEKATSLGLDCALSANALGYYNWNETADDASALFNKADRQSLVKLMTTTYDMLYNVDARHSVAPLTIVEAPKPAQTFIQVELEREPDLVQPAVNVEPLPAISSDQPAASAVPEQPVQAPAAEPAPAPEAAKPEAAPTTSEPAQEVTQTEPVPVQSPADAPTETVAPAPDEASTASEQGSVAPAPIAPPPPAPPVEPAN